MSYKSTILIVDDEPIGRQLIDAILYKEGYNLEFAENGREAFDKAKSINPDLILMDVMMPEIDGFEVCQMLRADESMTNVPIILVTALDDIDSRIRGLEAGADDYISKPFDRLELLARIKIITRLNRYRKTESTQGKEPEASSAANVLPDSSILINASAINISSTENELKTHFANSFICSVFNEEKSCDITVAHNSGEIKYALLAGSSNNPEESALNLLNTITANKLITGSAGLKPDEILKQTLKNTQNKISKIKLSENSKPSFSIINFNTSSSELNFSGFNSCLIHVKNDKIDVITINTKPYLQIDSNGINLRSVKVEKDDIIILLSDPLGDTTLDNISYFDLIKNILIEEKNNINNIRDKIFNLIKEDLSLETRFGNIKVIGISF